MFQPFEWRLQRCPVVGAVDVSANPSDRQTKVRQNEDFGFLIPELGWPLNVAASPLLAEWRFRGLTHGLDEEFDAHLLF
jgi:hypothetical protein